MTKDELIIEHLGRFTENNIFKASVEHWLATGKASGSFRSFLHSMMEDHTKQQITSLESQLKQSEVNNQNLLSEIRKYMESEREGYNKALDDVYELFKRGQITQESLQNLMK